MNTKKKKNPKRIKQPFSKNKQTYPLKQVFEKWRKKVDRALDYYLPPANHFPSALHSALRYSLFSGGKRLRPILAFLAAEACGGSTEAVLPAACALECIHTYSLIHDDLPSMDNDDLRRGRPTCHKVYGEAAALLAGDALLTFAFELMTKVKPQPKPKAQENLLEAIKLLAQGAGFAGMVGGQMADLKAEGKDIDVPMLQYIHTHKTGCLIQAALRIGALLAGATTQQVKALSSYGENIGLAFQITDDILNVVGNAKTLGKNIGTDVVRKKATYPAVFGVEEARRQAQHLMVKGINALPVFGKSARGLEALAEFIIQREV